MEGSWLPWRLSKVKGYYRNEFTSTQNGYIRCPTHHLELSCCTVQILKITPCTRLTNFPSPHSPRKNIHYHTLSLGGTRYYVIDLKTTGIP